MVILEADQLTFTYAGENRPALQNINLSIQEGEFFLLCGRSGSGKSTLLRLMKPEISPHGILSGEVRLRGQSVRTLHPRESARKIGFVFQDPENQPVMDTVLDELVFGLENIGMETEKMRERLAEMSHYFDIYPLLDEPIHHLSGGQKQLVNLAAVLMMEPSVLLLDEPAASLDPVSAKNFFNILKRMNEELGITIIIAEHRLEDVLPVADRLAVLEQGTLVEAGSPRSVAARLWQRGKEEKEFLPAVSRLYLEFEKHPHADQIPLSVKEGRSWVSGLTPELREEKKFSAQTHSDPILEARQVIFQYERDGNRTLDHCSLRVHPGEWLAVVGPNGSGKSTLLKILSGILKPRQGQVRYRGKKLPGPLPGNIGFLPQTPKALFIRDTLLESFQTLIQRRDSRGKSWLQQWISYFRLEPLLDRHPFDLSGGEIQLAALAALLAVSPDVLLLDEPVKGMDPVLKKRVGNLLKVLNKDGMTIVMVTHDVEFAAAYADRCAMLFRGSVSSISTAENFFKRNLFYTTSISRMTRAGTIPEVSTIEEAKRKWIFSGGGETKK